MSATLWDVSASELLRRASSGDPTPGGGAIAAVTAAFGMGLVVMAIEVTLPTGSTPEDATRDQTRLGELRGQLRELQAGVVAAVDRDVAEFEAVMGAYRMARGTETEQAARRDAIEDATVSATREPLSVAEACVAAVRLGEEVEPLVKPAIVSDVLAGCDLLRGATMAALRTADINLVVLEERGHGEAVALRQRRDAAMRDVAGTQEEGR